MVLNDYYPKQGSDQNYREVRRQLNLLADLHQHGNSPSEKKLTVADIRRVGGREPLIHASILPDLARSTGFLVQISIKKGGFRKDLALTSAMGSDLALE